MLWFSVSAFLACSAREAMRPQITFIKPPHFPEPVYRFENNPITTDGFELGRALFYDGALSRDGSISCGECHQQSAGFTHHGHDLSHGIDDQLSRRNSLPVMNLAWHPAFFWDGGVHDLDLFSIAPIENPVEMDEQLGNVLNKIRNNPKYPPLFAKAFGSPEVTTDRFLKAISQFMLMCISADSRYDRHLQGKELLNSEELKGLALFEQKCAGCHSGVLFTDFSYRNNGLNNQFNPDKGRAEITLNPDDDFKFKVPSLRNVAITAPYMHDGRFYTLDEVLTHYQIGVHDLPTLDTQLRHAQGLGIRMTDEEKRYIILFLHTLTDEQFIRNPLLSEF
jgi:cytochrome c peroxidase